MKRKYTYRDIKQSLPKEKRRSDSFWGKLWAREASFWFTYLFINAGWTANMVSLLSWIVVTAGAILLSFNQFWCMLAGIILTVFWGVLDGVDGNIARVKKTNSFMGDFFDAAAGYAPFSITTIALGMAAFHTSFLIPEPYRWVLILIGGVGATANVYMRLLHQKYMNCFFAAKCILNETEDITLQEPEDKHSFAYIRYRIDMNLGVAGLFNPWLFVALFTNTFDIMVICYSAYYILAFLAICVVYSKKASDFEKYAQEKRREMDRKD